MKLVANIIVVISLLLYIMYHDVLGLGGLSLSGIEWFSVLLVVPIFLFFRK